MPPSPYPHPQRAKTNFSVGAGAFFAGDFGGGIAWDAGGEVAMPFYGGGAYLFFDAAYAEAFLAYSGGGDEIAGTKLKAKSGWDYGNGTDDFGFSAFLFVAPRTAAASGSRKASA